MFLVATLTCGISEGMPSTSASWIQGNANAQRNSFVGGDFDPSRLRLAWNFEIDPPWPSSGFWQERGVATDGDHVYRTFRGPNTGEGTYRVVALDLASGGEVWRRVLTGYSGDGVGEPTVAQGKIWVNRDGHSSVSGGSYENLPKLYAFSSSTGETLSVTTYSAQFGYNDRPTTNGNDLIAQSGYFGGMSSYSAADGTRNWSVSGPQGVAPRAALTDSHAFAFSNVYSLQNGGLIRSIVHPEGKSLTLPMVTPGGTLVYRTYVGTPYSEPTFGLAAFDSSTFEFQWDITLGSDYPALGANRDAIVVALDNTLILLDEHTGEEQGSFAVVGNTSVSRDIALTNNYIFLQSQTHTVAVDTITGEECWRVLDTGELAIGDGYVFLSDVYGIRAYAVPIPEPSTFALGMLSLALLATAVRQKSSAEPMLIS